MQNLNDCGCCEGLSQSTPVQIYNRPELDAISYRVGDHQQFLESLINRLSTSRLKALTGLTTREKDDFTLGLLDAWATVSDVLTFYQERIANESYLGTATEQFSILELARLIGYELRPGVAASTYLAFTIDENSLVQSQLSVSGISTGKSEIPPITLDSGIQVQSIPEKDEKPQTYETIEPLEARAEWNLIRPRTTQRQINVKTNNLIIVAGTNNNINVGNVLLLGGTSLKKVNKIYLDEEAKTTWIYFSHEAVLPNFTEKSEFTPNGNSDDIPKESVLNKELVRTILGSTWTSDDLSALIEARNWSAFELKESMELEVNNDSIPLTEVLVFRQSVAPFGYNAPKELSYDNNDKPLPQSSWSDWKLEENGGELFLDAVYDQITENSHIAVQKGSESLQDADLYEVSAVNTRSKTDYGISGKSTVLSISPKKNWWDLAYKDISSTGYYHQNNEVQFFARAANPSSNPSLSTQVPQTNYKLGAIRYLTIYAQSEPLQLTQVEIIDAIKGNTISLSAYYPGLKKNQNIILSGEREDLPRTYANEVRKITEIYIYEGISVLVLDQELNHTYLRKTVTINANVAAATHGATAREVLGSGDASKTFQKFLLKQPPLTFISAANASGTQSTLEVRVNDILWKEVSSLYGKGPDEHIYITRQDDQGKTTVIFGDGITGARLPSGQQNITVTYRKGIGTGGLLKAHQLSQLITRPLGVKAVDNPTFTSGAQDREQLKDARRNANLTIHTLGRIISLQDYEDFARAFAGISKAMSTWAWCKQRRCIFLTVAGYDGAEVEYKGDLYMNLLNAIHTSSVPGTSIEIKSYVRKFFRLSARIKVHPDYITDQVILDVESTLRSHFSFDQRDFGQPVTLGEVYEVIQRTRWVMASDIDHLYLVDDGIDAQNSPKDRLEAKAPIPGDTKTIAAELLTLDLGIIDLNEMS